MQFDYMFIQIPKFLYIRIDGGINLKKLLKFIFGTENRKSERKKCEMDDNGPENVEKNGEKEKLLLSIH